MVSFRVFGGVREKSILPSLNVLTHDTLSHCPIVHCPLSIVPFLARVCEKRLVVMERSWVIISLKRFLERERERERAFFLRQTRWSSGK